MNFKIISLIVSLMGIMPLEASIARRSLGAAKDSAASYIAMAASKLSARPTGNVNPTRGFIPSRFRTDFTTPIAPRNSALTLAPREKQAPCVVSDSASAAKPKSAVNLPSGSSPFFKRVLSYEPAKPTTQQDSKQAKEPRKSKKEPVPAKETAKPQAKTDTKSLSEYVVFEKWEKPTAVSQASDTGKVEVVQTKPKKQSSYAKPFDTLRTKGADKTKDKRAKRKTPVVSVPKNMGKPAIEKPINPIRRTAVVVQPTPSVIAVQPAMELVKITPLNWVNPFDMPAAPKVPTWEQRFASKASESSMALVPTRTTPTYRVYVPTQHQRPFATTAPIPSQSDKRNNRGYSWHDKAFLVGAGAAALGLMALQSHDSKENKELTESNSAMLIDQKAMRDAFKSIQELLLILSNPSRFDKKTLDEALAKLTQISIQAEQKGYRIKLIEASLLHPDMQTDDINTVNILRYNQNQTLTDGNDKQLALSKDNTGEIGTIISGKRITLPVGVDTNGQPIMRDFYLALESNQMRSSSNELAITDHQHNQIVGMVLDPRTHAELISPAALNKVTTEKNTIKTPAVQPDYSLVPALVQSPLFVDAPQVSANVTAVPAPVMQGFTDEDSNHSPAYYDEKEHAEAHNASVAHEAHARQIRSEFPALGLQLAYQRNNQNEPIEFPDLSDGEDASAYSAHTNPVRWAIREHGHEIREALAWNLPMKEKEWTRGCTELIDTFIAYNKVHAYCERHPLSRRARNLLEQCKQKIYAMIHNVSAIAWN